MNAFLQRFSPSWAWVAVAIPLLALTGRALVTDENFAFRDAAHYYYPQFEWEDRQWQSGSVPLWNPQDNLGTSVAADPTASLFYPGKLLFRLPLNFGSRYKFFILAHLLGAAIGAYVLGRTWRCSPAAAALLAISFACGGNVLFLYSNVVYLVGAAWLPWAVVALERLMRETTTLAVLALSAVLAMMILGGDPQAALHVVMIGLLRVAFEFRLVTSASLLPSPAPLSALQHSVPIATAPTRRRQALLIVAAGALAFALSAVQCVPSLVAARRSGRAAFDEPRSVWEIVPWLRAQPHNSPSLAAGVSRGLVGPPRDGTHHQQIYDFSVGPWRLIELLVPNAFGKMFPRYARWGFAIPAEGRVWTPSLYQGLLPALLALAGVLAGIKRRRDATQRWLTWTAALAILGGFGSYGLGWLVREICGDLAIESPEWLGDATGGVYWFFVTFVPSYVQFRYPAKLWTVAALAVAGLAARTFDRVTNTTDANAADDTGGANANESACLRTWLRRLSGTVATACTCLLVALPILKWTGRWSAWLHGVPNDPWLGPLDVSRAYTDTAVALASSLLIAVLGWWLTAHVGRRAASSRMTATRWAWVAITAVDLVVAHQWLVVTAPQETWAAGTKTLETVGPRRFWRSGGSSNLPSEWEQMGSDDRLIDTVRWDAVTLFSKMHLLGHSQSIESPVATESLDYLALLQVAREEGQRHGEDQFELPRTLRDMLGVGVTLVPEITTSTTARRAWIVRDIERLPELDSHSLSAERKRTREVLFPRDRLRDWTREAVVESDLDNFGAGAETAESKPSSESVPVHDQVRVRQESLHRVLVEVELPSPAMLVLADRFDPEWYVEVRNAQDDPLEDAAIVRTNRVCRGVWLPAGRWTVDFRYRPTSVVLGATVSVLSWLGWIVLLLRVRL